jgi:hypothetical protein
VAELRFAHLHSWTSPAAVPQTSNYRDSRDLGKNMGLEGSDLGATEGLKWIPKHHKDCSWKCQLGSPSQYLLNLSDHKRLL